MDSEILPGSILRVLVDRTHAKKANSSDLFKAGDLATVRVVLDDRVVVESEGNNCNPHLNGTIYHNAQVLLKRDVELVTSPVIQDGFFRDLLGD